MNFERGYKGLDENSVDLAALLASCSSNLDRFSKRKEFDSLPTPESIMDNGFFDIFLTKPADFDEKTAIYFNSGF